MDIYSFLPLIALVVNLFLGVYILLKKSKDRSIKLYVRFSFAFAFWALVDFFIFSAKTAESALWWERWRMVGALFTFALLLHFVLAFTKRKWISKKTFLLFLYLPILFFIWLRFSTGLIVSSMELKFWGYSAVIGKLYPLVSGYIIFLILASLCYVYNFYRTSRLKKEKKQSQYLLLAISIPLIGGFITEAILPIFRITIIPLSTTLATIMAIVIAYSILKHQFISSIIVGVRKIKFRIILSFIAIVLLIAIFVYFFVANMAEEVMKKTIGKSSVSLAQETMDKIDKTIYSRIEEWQLYMSFSAMRQAINESNKEFNEISNIQSYVQEKDKEWISAPKHKITPFMDLLINNDLSSELKNKIKFYNERYGYNVVAEVFITNKHGANLIQTNKTSDYYQADELWWQRAKQSGLYVTDVGYDRSAEVFSTDICLRIDDASGNFIGVAKIVLNIREVIDIIDNSKLWTNQEAYRIGEHASDTTEEFKLLDKNYNLIYSTEADGFEIFEKISDEISLRLQQKSNYFIFSGDKPNEEEKLFSYTHSKGFRDYNGLGWILIIEHDAKEVFQSLILARNNVFLIFSGILFFVFLLGLFISRSISRSIEDLRQGVILITKGNLDHKVGTKAMDEIGELSRAFDSMTVSLKESRTNIKQKVEEQTKKLTLHKRKLEKQQVAVLNILDDVEREKDRTNEEKKKIDAILQSIGDAVFVVDEKLKIIMFNKIASKLSGFTVEEALGKRYNNILRFVYEKDNKINDKFIREAMVQGRITEMSNHTLLIRKDGSKIPVADSAAPLKNIDGEIIGCVVVFRDVTKEREIDKMKTEFVSVASHQLRTPLTAISWFVERLRKGKVGKLTKKQKEYFNDIYQSTQRMIKLVNELLNVSRLETGALIVEPVPTKIVAIVQDVLRGVDPLAKKKQCKLTFIKPKSFPNIPLDEPLIRQVIHNLLTNAINYSARGKGQVVIKLTKESDNCILSVADNGIGIPKKQHKRIFEKFFRADNAQKLETEGSGLGLYISKMIIKSSEGKIWFQSEEGKGTKFYVSIPLSGMKKKEGKKSLS